ncbi:hypothetical protein [Streptomyces sp. NPDC056160]|uniref:hypothetical protein n=1 Tax=Streptomyces sp. NPDC056160 TaxID=3345731 RepID=UPI0035D7C8E9
MNDSVAGTRDRTEAAAQEPSAEHAVDLPAPAPGDAPAPGGPAPLGVPRTPTGDADVDAVLERLGDADHLDTDGHLGVYEDVHGGLRDALTALDARPEPSRRPGPPGPSAPPAPSPSYRHRS